MANISVTNTFVNGNTLDATQVNQNFSDIINGTSDGTRDITVATINTGSLVTTGDVTFGNATGDNVTVTGSLASTINIKTNSLYDLGDATHGLASLFIGGTSTFTTKLTSAATASYTLQFPATAPAAGKVQRFTSASASSFEFDNSPVVSKAFADTPYTVASTDKTVLIDASGGSVTVNLITAVGNAGRIWEFLRTDATTTTAITLDPAGSETIGGASTYVLKKQYESLRVISDGTNLQVLSHYKKFAEPTKASSSLGGLFTTTNTVFTDVTNASLNIQTSGRPVQIAFVGDGTNPLYIGGSQNASGNNVVVLRLKRDATVLADWQWYDDRASSSSFVPLSISHIDMSLAAGDYQYFLQIKNTVGTGGSNASVSGGYLVAWEIGAAI